MIFNPSPALRKIRQFVRLIRRDPISPRPARYAPWPVQDLPDPDQFVDSSVRRNTAGSDESGSHTRRKRASCPGRRNGEIGSSRLASKFRPATDCLSLLGRYRFGVVANVHRLILVKLDEARFVARPQAADLDLGARSRSLFFGDDGRLCSGLLSQARHYVRQRRRSTSGRWRN